MIVVDFNEKLFLDKGSYIALGNFDGIHLGHQALLNSVKILARKNNCNSMVFSFKNHPLSIIAKDKAPKLLMDNSTKCYVLEGMGIDIVCLAKFDEEFMKIEPEVFISLLVKKYNVKGIVVGFNYKFGYKNRGNISLLKELSKIYNFELTVIESQKSDENLISSTYIRNVIELGDVALACRLLGRPFSIKGIVIDGRKIGRTIGFPTANLRLKENYVLPKTGVYYTNVVYDNTVYKGITSVGFNPTVDGKELTIETYILDFNKNIYNDELNLAFIERIRNEEKFNNIDELIAQLQKDLNYAKKQPILLKL